MAGINVTFKQGHDLPRVKDKESDAHRRRNRKCQLENLHSSLFSQISLTHKTPQKLQIEFLCVFNKLLLILVKMYVCSSLCDFFFIFFLS